MNITKPQAAPADHAVAVLLAQLLQRLDQSAEPVGAEQYRSVVRHLSAEFESLPTDATLSALLDACPAAAELYENLNYQFAGLCRSSLDLSLDAEQRARQAIHRAMRRDPKPADAA